MEINTFFFENPTITLGRTLSEFWHWFVANIPGDSVDDGEVDNHATIISPQMRFTLRSFLTSSSPLFCLRAMVIIVLATLL